MMFLIIILYAIHGTDRVLHGLQTMVQAVPHVAGAAALLKAADPGFDFSNARKVLLNSAVRVPSLKGKCASEGKLDVGAALEDVLLLRKERWKNSWQKKWVAKPGQADRRLER